MKKDFSPAVFQDRLNEFKEISGLNNEELASAAKISSQAVSNYFKIGSIPKLTVLAFWSRKLGLSADWLLSGLGEMLLSGEASNADSQGQSSLDQRDDLLRMLIVQNKELTDRLVSLTEENATLKANEKMLLLSIEGKQERSDVSHASGKGSVAPLLRDRTE